MWVKAYKLLGIENKSVSGIHKYAIAYEIGKEHVPLPNTVGLFVFDTLEHAVNFAHRGIGMVIHECIVSNPSIIERISAVSETYDAIDNFYLDSRYASTVPAPTGTLVCDKLILLDKIWERKLVKK